MCIRNVLLISKRTRYFFFLSKLAYSDLMYCFDEGTLIWMKLNFQDFILLWNVGTLWALLDFQVCCIAGALGNRNQASPVPPSPLTPTGSNGYTSFIQEADIDVIFVYSTGKSKRGELSIFPKTFTVLSHCLHMMPKQRGGTSADTPAKVLTLRKMLVFRRNIYNCWSIAFIRVVQQEVYNLLQK